MTHGSLFSGAGGFDIAAHWCGWTNVFSCDSEPFVKQILRYWFPNTIQYDDIRTADFSAHRGTIDIISGGFPCQPFSQAGRGLGTEDDRYLWAEMFQAIRVVSPRWVVAENVRRIITHKRGVVFERVQADLESAGYAVQSFVVPACAVDSPHERYRAWVVAYRDDAGAESVQSTGENSDSIANITAHTSCSGRQAGRARGCFSQNKATKRTNICSRTDGFGKKSSAANAAGKRPRAGREVGKSGISIPNNGFDRFPTQSPLFGGDDGFPAQLDGITVPAWRRKSIEAYGNAVVPQVAYEFFKIIDYIEKNKTK
jgi:DNA (cytosine-5)-methyltransferase 1